MCLTCFIGFTWFLWWSCLPCIPWISCFIVSKYSTCYICFPYLIHGKSLHQLINPALNTNSCFIWLHAPYKVTWILIVLLYVGRGLAGFSEINEILSLHYWVWVRAWAVLGNVHLTMMEILSERYFFGRLSGRVLKELETKLNSPQLLLRWVWGWGWAWQSVTPL